MMKSDGAEPLQSVSVALASALSAPRVSGYRHFSTDHPSKKFASDAMKSVGHNADVDHFFPRVLKRADFVTIIDGARNLVLARQWCNGGVAGKLDRLQTDRVRARLHARNEYPVVSHHPLRETLIAQTGGHEVRRRGFLREMHARAWTSVIHLWEPE
jgi:hypothetical protein